MWAKEFALALASTVVLGLLWSSVNLVDAAHGSPVVQEESADPAALENPEQQWIARTIEFMPEGRERTQVEEACKARKSSCPFGGLRLCHEMDLGVAALEVLALATSYNPVAAPAMVRAAIDVYCPQYRESVGAGIEAADRIQKAFIVRTIELLPEGRARADLARDCSEFGRACKLWDDVPTLFLLCDELHSGRSPAQIAGGPLGMSMGKPRATALVNAAAETYCPAYLAAHAGSGGATPESSAGLRTEPVPICKRDQPTQWESFYCRFMTDRLWVEAGRPAFADPQPGRRWIPVFYRDGRSCTGGCAASNDASTTRPVSTDPGEGLLEGFELADDAERPSGVRRYAPWSRHVRTALGCSPGQIVNPFRLQDPAIPRSDVLGLAWEGLPIDQSDPSEVLESGSMFILFTVANLRRLYDGEGPDRVDEGTLYAIGHGGSRLQPNYERNAEIRLVTAEGQVLAISDAAVAAEQAAQGALVFVNDVLRTAEAAIGEAKDLAKYAKKPVLAVYLAQDFFSPKNDNQPVRAVLWTLAKDTAAQGRELQVVAHGWGGFLAIRELYTRKNVRIQAINPYPNPWHRNQYVIPLRDSLAKIEIIAGNRDFLMLLGGGPGGGGAQIDPAACW